MNAILASVGEGSEGAFLDPATSDTLIGPDAKRAFRERVITYAIFGPLGSQGHKMPSNVAELHRVLNDEASQTSEDWKRNTAKRNMPLGHIHGRYLGFYATYL